MGFSITSNCTTIFKDERGVCFANVMSRELKEGTEDEYINKFAKINVKFKKGVEIKNKTKIKINDGFLTFFQQEKEEISEKTGKPVKHNFFKIIVMDFEVLEDGIDEPFRKKFANNENNSSQSIQQSTDFDTINMNIYGGEDDDLPF